LLQLVLSYATSNGISPKKKPNHFALSIIYLITVPAVEKNVEEPPPFTILVQGPPGVGKSTLIKCLIKHYTRQDVRDAKGPVTVVAGKTRRLAFIECPQDLNGMIDAAKYADLVLLLIDGAFGFEMETFEFLNILQVHGFPKVMGVLTHLDGFKDVKALKKTKKALKHRFWSEIYPGAKLFYLSGIKNAKYLHREVHNLARFVSVMKFRPLQWRQSHPFLVADRVEDVTPAEAVRQDPRCDRDISLYGYVRGTNWKEGVTAHIAGVGDFKVVEAVALPDPCPLPGQMKRRTLNEKERLIYAPMSDIGGLLYDKDAMYIDIPDWKLQFSHASVLGNRSTTAPSTDGLDAGEGEAMVRGLQGTRMAVDEKIKASKIQLFAGGKAVSHADVDGWETAAAARETENGGFSSEEDEDSDFSDEEESEEEESDGECSSDDEEGDADGGAFNRRKGQGPEEHQVVHSRDGRVRRRAIFPGGSAAAGALGEDEEERTNEHGGEKGRKKEALRYDDESEEDEEGESSEDEGNSEDYDSEQEEDEGLGGAATWKGAMLQRAAALFSARAADLQQYIYGTRATADENELRGRGEYENGSEDDDDELFRPKKGRNSSFGGTNGSNYNNTSEGDNDVFDSIDAADCSRADVSSALLTKWAEPEAAEELRNRFVTGDWDAGAARAAARPGADSESDGGDDDLDNEGEVFGDFEDVETGEKFAGSSDPATRAAAVAIKAAEAEAEAEDLAAKRAAKKAAFNAEYDESGGSKGIKDALSPEAAAAAAAVGGKKGKNKFANDDDDEETYYDAMKRDMSERAERTKIAMDALDPVQRVIMEGHRPGAYVRLHFTGVPCEFIENFDPRQPILIGGLGRGEETPGYMQLRLKRHRWFPKILKNRDPLIFSIGWRRFQSLPVFAIKDNNERHRMLKYSPEHMHCLAAIYGPLAPPGTGVLAVQKTNSGVSHWRIAATGVVLQLDASLKVVKKLKLVGTPFKIHRHTAFVNGMFNSQLEAAKFEGASIRSVSGIRGTIKKAVRVGTQSGARDGAYRATFEDKPLLSDVVFLRAWIEVDIPKFHTPVTNLLARPNVEGVKRKPKPFSKNRPKPEEENYTADGEPYLLENGVARGSNGVASLIEERDRKYLPAFKFNGAKAGYVFTTGKQGLGYYEDLGRLKRGKATNITGAAEHDDSGFGADASKQQNEDAMKDSGWLGMRSVADLRRKAGVGAPRNSDSLYKPIERKKRVFNPLRVPSSLQAALPFKTKPKLEAKRKRKSLEQRRAVVVEPEERKAMSLVAQLNAIRNAKAVARRDQKAKHAVKQAKAAVAEEEWRAAYNKEERKKRYVERGHAEKTKAKRARGD